MAHNHFIKTALFTALALTAFAANSVLCRLALGEGAIDASSFTLIRLVSGIIVLMAIVSKARPDPVSQNKKGNWPASIMLFVYAITFSFAYLTLDTGTGALILFGSVQITMILLSIFSGTRLHISEWIGTGVAFAGFVYLVLPGVTAPSTIGFLLMAMAGIAWGGYTLMGRASTNPLVDTSYNFLRTLPLVIVLFIVSIKTAHYSLEGIVYAILSGGIASGIGYTIWYIALGGLTATQAAVVQLLVPVIAALGGIVFVSEVLTSRLIVSATMILGGILLVFLGRYFAVQYRSS